MKKLFFVFLLLFTGYISAQSPEDGNDYCFKCHQMETMGVRNPETGIVKNFAVPPEEFNNSQHGYFYCTDCHDYDYAKFPHPEYLRGEELYCLDCHENDPDPNLIQFETIEEAFEESVHSQNVEEFDCFSCHDPHIFEIKARVTENIKEVVKFDNQICLQCHSEIEKIGSISEREFRPLSVIHDFLPHQEIHWKNVRCLDCHADADQPGVSHLILPAADAVHNCVECHSTDTRLAQTLYKFELQKERAESGFFNSIILNNSYIIGANRNYYLNVLSFVFFGLTLAALGIHGYFYAGSRKKKSSAKVHKEYFYPIYIRIWHWSNALIFIVLIFSGITLQYASTDDPFLSFDMAITMHNTAGVLLTINYLLFFIGNLVSGDYKQYIPRIKGLINRMYLQGKFYLIGIFRNHPHPFETSRRNKFNPLQGVTYFKIMYVAIPIMIITGWAMLFPEVILEEFFAESGFFWTAILHTVVGFFLSLFMFGHIYLATLGRTRTSNIKAMVTGWHEHEEHNEHEHGNIHATEEN